jgi:hypothetical protein
MQRKRPGREKGRIPPALDLEAQSRRDESLASVTLPLNIEQRIRTGATATGGPKNVLGVSVNLRLKDN